MADVVNVGNIQIANAVSVVYTAGDNINISDDRVISATVPTKTSDLTNDSGYITNETDGLVNYTTTNQMNTLLNAKADKNNVYTKTESDARYPLSSNVYSKTESDSKYSTIPETGNKIEVSINSSTYVMTMNLKDKNNNILSTGTVDLPLESVVVSGRYDDTTKELVLTLQNGNEIRISVADLISGLQETLIAGDNIQINGNTISATDTTYTAGENVTITGTTISAKDTTYELSGETEDDVTTITLTDSDGGTSTATVDCSKYQEELDTLNEIVDGLPHVEGEGVELLLSPTIKAPLKSTLKGNTTQTTYTGRNLFNVFNEQVGTQNQKSPTISSDGTITSTSNFSDLRGKGIVVALDSSTTYTFSFNVDSFTTTTSPARAHVEGKIYENNSVVGEIFASTSYTTTGQKSITFTTPVIGSNQKCGIVFNGGYSSGGVVSSTYSQAMIETGSSVSSYEPYVGGIASPNPDYPQKVKVVTGDNTVMVCGKNLFSGYTKGVGLSTVDGSETVSTKSATSGYIPVDLSNSAKYTLTGLPDTLFNLIAAYDSNKKFLGRTGGGNPTSWTFNSTSFAIGTKLGSGDIKYVRVTFYEHGSVTGVIDDIDDAQIMLEHGATASTYEPYTGQNYPINLGVVNLFNKNNANTTDLFINISTNKYQQNNNAKLLYIDCKPNTTYTVSRVAGQRFIVGDSANVPAASGDVNNAIINNTATSITTTTSATANYLAVFYYLSTADTIPEQQILDSMQIEEGSTASSYSPYGVAPVELCKIGNYQDSFVKQNDKWYKKQLVRHLSLPIADMNNSESYPGWKDVVTMYNDYPQANNSIVGITSMACNLIPSTSLALRVNNTTAGVIYISRVLIDKSQTEWKTNYPNLVCELYYGLKTADLVEITNQTLISQLDAMASASSYKPETNISSMYNTDNAQIIISASALYDLGALINA